MRLQKFWIRITKWFSTRPNAIGFLAFFLMLFLVFFVVKLRYNVIKENEHREMSNIINVVHQNFEQLLKNSYTITLTLAMTINDDGKPENFEKVASNLVNTNSYISAVELLPDGIIKYVYPLKGNEKALNFNVLKPSEKYQEVEKSMHNNMIYFAGPLKLKQGGYGVVGRLPIYKKNKFWGFSSIVIRLEKLIEISGIKSIDESKYYFQFSKINPVTKKEEFFLPKKTDFSKCFYEDFFIKDGDWKLYLISDNGTIFYQIITSCVLGFLLSVIFGLWVASIMKKPAQLQKLIYKQARKIFNTESEFKAIFDQAPIGIVRIESDSYRFIDVNKEYCKIVGYSEQELKKMTFKEITHPEDLEVDLNFMEELKLNKIKEFSLEKRYIHKNGNIVWVNLLVSNFLRVGNTKEYIIGILEDITEKKRAEADLQYSFELVTEQNKRLLNFSYIVSHNLRSHTSNIETISGFLETADTQEERDEMVGLLKKVSHSLNETLANLNEVVSIRTNVTLTVEELNLFEFIENAKTVLSEQIVLKKATIKNEVDEAQMIEYNPAYLESILYNFISNAIRYSHPERNPEITITFNKKSNSLSIKDNGIGIDLKKNGSKLFGMYKTFTNNPESKGIGLFITKNQVEAMGGKIEVKSELNIGTTFIIYLK